jgi:hypothetical protein
MAKNSYGGTNGKVPGVRSERASVGTGARVGQTSTGKTPHSADPRDWRSRGVSEVPGLGQQPTNAKSPTWETKTPEQRRDEVEAMRDRASKDTPQPW